MAFIPYEKFDIVTDLDQIAVVERLRGQVGTKQPNWLKSGYVSYKNYTGWVQQDNFEIERVIVGRNSFNPLVKGTITPDGQGCIIRVVMALDPFVLAFLCLWMLAAFAAGIIIAVGEMERRNFKGACLIPFFMLLLAYLLATGCFMFESDGIKAGLEELLEAKGE
jgi:hypothetical protein